MALEDWRSSRVLANRSLFLKRVLVSVAAQDFGDYLHIVVNDGGDRDQVSDCIRTLPEESRSKVVQLDNPISLGREGAVNPGFEHALQVRSEYTVVLDDDDTWAPTFLSTHWHPGRKSLGGGGGMRL